MYRLVTSFVFSIVIASSAKAQIVINEFVSSNTSGIVDFEKESSDWIELYNISSSAIDLSKYFLSDNSTNLKKWQLPSTILNPSEFLFVFASGKDIYLEAEYHTNFKISRTGEYLILSKETGEIIDQIKPIELEQDVSFGRLPDGGDSMSMLLPASPGNSNNSSSKYASIHASLASGGYTKAQKLELHVNQPDVQIRYTLNGSTPTIESTVYSEPISIASKNGQRNSISDIPTTPLSAPEWSPLPTFIWKQPSEVYKGTVIRYAAFYRGAIISRVTSKFFIIDPKFSGKYSFPMVNISTDSAGLFDHDSGIYVPGKVFENNNQSWWPAGNYHNTGMKWERKSSLTYLNENGVLGWEENAGIRVRGHGSAAMPQKSLNVYFRNEYGASRINYPIFREGNLESYKRFVLRNSGGDFKFTHFKDAVLQGILKPLNLELQNSSPVNVFMNGEYWGIHNIREKYDGHYIGSHYNIDSDSVIITNLCGYNDSGYNEDYAALMELADTADFTNNVVYNYMKLKIDIPNLIDYHIAEIYYANYDWPCNNKKLWKTKDDNSKWRFLVYDLDASFGEGELSSANYNSLEHATKVGTAWPHCECSSRIFRKLMENEKFKSMFIARFKYCLETVFSPYNVLAQIEAMKASYTPDMQKHVDRWGYPQSMSSWEWNIETMRKFAVERPCIMKNQIMEFFKLTEFDFDCFDPSVFRYPEKDGVFLYPNPIVEKKGVTINSRSKAKTNYTIISSRGQVISTGVIGYFPFLLDLNLLKNGMYIITFINSEGRYSKKIVVGRE